MSPIYTREGLTAMTPAKGVPAKGHPATCTCPVCQGLHTFVRPRFFAGQLLTDTDLTALSAYVIDKDKLHNRYLHGYGVVCGLQVECDGCGPGVIVRPGYALDPCGSDIVLPEAISVPIDKLIAQCTTAQRAADCDPPRHPVAKGCDDAEQVWCLWVRYHEQQARPVAPLGRTTPATTVAAGCTCGTVTGSGTRAVGGTAVGSSGGCGCGGSPAIPHTPTCGCTTAPAPVSRPAGCEPSRVYEYVEFGVAPKDEACDDLGTALAGTFPAKIVECITGLQPLLTKGMTKAMQSSALSVVAGGQVGLGTGVARDAVCQLYANVVELYRKDPMRTQCVLPEGLSEIDCSPQGVNETDNQYRLRLALGLQQLVMLVLLYLRDCVCYAALPPCPGPVCDDRVVLACVTVRDGVVVRVCNHSCRRYAGSFVNREYWLPIGPVLSLLAAQLCCFPLGLRRRGLRDMADAPENLTARPNALRSASALGRFDNILSALRADDYALVGLWRHRLATTLRRVKLDTVLGEVERALENSRGAVRLASYLHADAAEASAALAKKGVKVALVEVTDKAEGIAFDVIPRTAEGGEATLYTHGGVVVGVRGSEGLRLFNRKARR